MVWRGRKLRAAWSVERLLFCTEKAKGKVPKLERRWTPRHITGSWAEDKIAH
jgi:hypothetical protein